MGAGFWVLGAVFCLLATVVLVAIVFVGLRWFLDQGRPRTTDAADSRRGPATERIER